jgi:hypothetical protein
MVSNMILIKNKKMSILTDRVIFSGSPASNDLIHIVDVSDPTDNPAGTSFAIEVGNLVSSSPFTGLTTTGTSGAATLVSGTLNVPEYAGGVTSIIAGTNISISPLGGTGNVTVSSGGVTIDPYQDEGNVNSITWDVSGTSTNYEATLTGDTTLNITNVRNGDYGTLIVTQDGTGSHTLSFGAGINKVVNGGGGAPTLTATAGATDILSFTYNGSTFYWTVGNDYT